MAHPSGGGNGGADQQTITSLKRLPVPRPLSTTAAGDSYVHLDELVTAQLRIQGAEIETLALRLHRVRQHGEVRLFYGASTTDDLAVTTQIINRHSILSRLLRKAGVARSPRAPSSAPRKTFNASPPRCAHLWCSCPTGRLVTRCSRRSALPPTASEIASAWETAAAHGAVYARSSPPGHSLWVLATTNEPLAAIADLESAGRFTDDLLGRASVAAVEAVRAVPELRWAAVRLRAADGAPRNPITIEAMTQSPRYPASAQLIAGDLNRAVEAIIPRPASASRARWWWPLRRRRPS